jgi:hypothetical protein
LAEGSLDQRLTWVQKHTTLSATQPDHTIVEQSPAVGTR